MQFDAPPLTPDNDEIVLPEDASFTALCISEIRATPSGRTYQLGVPLLTRSEKWGLIWRVDYQVPGLRLYPLINRVVCWQAPGSGIGGIITALGQELQPLPSTR
jgi:hypothetical protein